MASQGKGIQGTGSIFTKLQLKRKNSKDGGGKQMKRRATFATVTDMVFGKQPKPGLLPQVDCAIPRTRKEKYLLGSPFKNKVA